MKKIAMYTLVLMLTLVLNTGVYAAGGAATGGNADNRTPGVTGVYGANAPYVNGTTTGTGYTRGYGNTMDGVNTTGTRTYNTYRTNATNNGNWGWLGLLGLIGLAGLGARDRKRAD